MNNEELMMTENEMDAVHRKTAERVLWNLNDIIDCGGTKEDQLLFLTGIIKGTCIITALRCQRIVDADDGDGSMPTVAGRNIRKAYFLSEYGEPTACGPGCDCGCR